MFQAPACASAGCACQSTGDDTSLRLFSLSKLLYLLAFVSLYAGLLLFWVHKASMRNMDHVTLSDTFVRQGTLMPHYQDGLLDSLQLQAADGRSWRCPATQCAYEGIERDQGKPSRIWLLDGKIVQIEVGGEMRMSLEEGVQRLQNYPLAYFFLGITPFFILFGWTSSVQTKAKYRG
jgi:hypothetical protein